MENLKKLDLSKNKNRWLLLGGLGVIVVSIIIYQVVFKSAGGNNDKVYVQTIEEIMGLNNGASNSYSGIVEATQTQNINKDDSQKVNEIFVKVGDAVEEGTPLFSYDTEDAYYQISSLTLEIEGIDNQIASLKAQNEELKKEKAEAPDDKQLEYTIQIQDNEMAIKEQEYTKKSKYADMNRYQQAIDNSVVTSKIAGVVKSINNEGYDQFGNTQAFMSIMATGDYLIKGKVDEQNVFSLTVDQPVLVRSRVDETKVWKGVITLIDTETVEDGNSNDYMMGGGSGESTSQYPFYIKLEKTDGLLLGQHVLIELDYGQTTKLEGIWLDESYIVFEDNKAYVWASTNSHKLEKRSVTLGEYNEELMRYEITEGLTMEDAITWPMPGLYKGITTVRDESEVDYNSPLYNPDSNGEEVPGDDGMIDDGAVDEGATPNDTKEPIAE